MSAEDLHGRYAQVGAWFAEHHRKIGESNQLQRPDTATSVRFGADGPPVVTRVLGDFDAAEEVVQDALLAAWQQWPAGGIPDRPRAWLWTVARRRAIDVLRRDLRYRQRAPGVSFPAEQTGEDYRLMLIFTCCHPPLSPEAPRAPSGCAWCGPGPAGRS